MAHDVFISYSHDDKAAADVTCATLEALGLRCWVAPRDISPGAEWGEEIIEAIDHASVMVLVFSSKANESRQVRREVEHAVTQGVTVMPLRIDQAQPAHSLAYFMAGVHWLDAMTPPLEAHLQRLAASIKALLGAAPDEGDQPRLASPPPATGRYTVPPGQSRAPRGGPGVPPWVILAVVAVIGVAATAWWAVRPSDRPGGNATSAGVETAAPVKPQNYVAPAPVATAGPSARDCPDCPEMATLPPGRFMMGSEVGEPDSRDDEKPRHAVTLTHAFAIGVYPVLRGEYEKFVAAGGPQTACPSFAQTERDPVVCVSWNDAKAYAAWLSKTTGHPYRLLSEAEWEYAARAGTTTERYWGDAIGVNNANCNGCGSQWDGKGTSPAGSFKPNAFGLYDMLGNVWEWVEDCYLDSYRETPADGSANTAGPCDNRVLRAGSWFFGPSLVRAALRNHIAPGTGIYTGFGFRVAKSLTP